MISASLTAIYLFQENKDDPMTTLFHVAQNWLNQDPDAETRAELTALLDAAKGGDKACLLYTSPSPRDLSTSRMPSSA